MIQVRNEDPGSESADGGLRLWEDPALLGPLNDFWYLVARRGSQVVGTWLVPLLDSPEGLVARRRVRLLPYASPLFFEEDARRRRAVALAFLDYLKEATAGLELPFSPDFRDLGGFNEGGCFVETRVTHMVTDINGFTNSQSRRFRNEVRAALKHAETTFVDDAQAFDFEMAVVTHDEAERDSRRHFGLALASLGLCSTVEVRAGDQVVGQSLIARAGGYSVVMHTWHDRECGIRGIPSLLVDHSVKHEILNRRAATVDLEGSILASVDYFMDGTGAKPFPHPFVYWYPDRAVLWRRLEMSMDIPGRRRGK